MATTTLVFAMAQNNPITTTSTNDIWYPINNTSSPLIDTMSGWDPASKKYTPKTAGYYAFSIAAVVDPTGGIALLKNDDGNYDNMNTDPALCITSASVTQWQSAVCFSYMNGTTDYVRFYGQSSSGTFPAIGSSPPCFTALLLP